MTADETIERQIVAYGRNTAPRVTPADLEANIADIRFFTAADGIQGANWPLPSPPDAVRPEHGLLTFCVLTLRNGFTVTGTSACASPENFDADIGKDIAFDNAKAKIWPLLGFLLRERLHSESAGK